MAGTLTRQQAKDAAKLHMKKFRESSGRMLIEGERLVADAIAGGARIEELYVEEGKQARFAGIIGAAGEVPLLTASQKIFSVLGDTVSPQGIAAVAALPDTDPIAVFDAVPAHMPLVALHGVSDPGNLGTVIRSTEWFGGGALLLSADSVDPFNPKAVRSSMGSLFRVRLGVYPSIDWLRKQSRVYGRALAAAVAGEGTPLAAWENPGGSILVLGSEAHGLPPALLASIHERVTIPGSGAESLNLSVSHAVMLYECSRRAGL